MADFTFLHAADLHLDTPFEGLVRVAPEIGEALRDASLVAFDRLVDRALKERVAFVVLAGDVYDGPERGLRAQLAFKRGLERLSAANIPVFVVHGNHDPVEEGWSAIRSWPPGVHVFGSDEVERRTVEHEGKVLAVVHGRSFARRAERSNLARTFARTSEPGLHVGLLHANVGGQPGHDDYAPCSLEDLRASRLDYWALGHVHTRQVLLEGETWAVYPGNLQGRSFKPSELGAKGASLVHVRSGRVERVEHVPLSPVRFEALQVDVTGCEDLGEVEQRLLSRAEERIESGVEGYLLSVELVGRSPLEEELANSLDEFARALDDATLGKTPWMHWARLRLALARPVDRSALLQRRDLLGALLRRLEVLAEDEEARKAMLAEVDAPLRSFRGWREAPGVDDEALLAEVEAEAVRKLEG